MPEIRYIKDTADWNRTAQKNKYLVANFTASWCGPCHQIKPFVDELYLRPEYTTIEFVRIDTDTLPDVCTKYGILSIPAFVLLEQNTEFARVTNNINRELPDALNRLAAKAKDDPSAKPRGMVEQSGVYEQVKQFIPSGFEILNDTIHLGGTVLLNYMPLFRENTDVKNVLRTDAEVLSAIYSDADSQGLFFIQLNNISKVHSILLQLGRPVATELSELGENELQNESQPPSLVKVWANKPSILSFDETASDSGAQNITRIDAADVPGWYEIKLKYVRFQSVQTLNIFIDGADEDSHTIVEKILLVGISGDQAKAQPINTDE